MSPRDLSASPPERLRALSPAPRALWIDGELDDAAPVVAIVGSRDCDGEARAFTMELAAAVVRAGAIVASGGALGIDAAAHRGALDADGQTWVVAPTGHRHVFPPEHRALFAEVARRGGTMVWPFAPDESVMPGRYAHRNRVLVALADAVVITQAHIPSGALNAAMWARKMGRPLFVAPVAPWHRGRFAGSRLELERGARLLLSIDGFLAAVGLRKSAAGSSRSFARAVRRPSRALSEHEKTVLATLDEAPRHLDEVVEKSYLPPQLASSALLTLALENVVVEGPAGFFRRGNPGQIVDIPHDIAKP